jgi:hypothetical protein
MIVVSILAIGSSAAVAAVPGPFTTTTSDPTPPVVSGYGLCVNGSAVAHVTWTATAGALSYTLVRDGIVRQAGLPPESVSYDDVLAFNGDSGSYAVVAVLSGSTLQSNTVRLSAYCPLRTPILDATLSACDGMTKSAVVHLSWTALQFPSALVHTIVMRNGVSIGTVSSSTLTYDDSTVAAGHTYIYEILASDLWQAPSNSVSIATCPVIVPVTAPVLKTLSECDGAAPKAHLTWTTDAGASTYTVLRGGSLMGTVPITTFDDTTVLPNQAYVYVIRANGPGGTADSAAATLVVAPCSQPHADLSVSALTLSALTVMPGELLTINFSVTNAGERDAPPTTTRLRLGAGTDPQPNDTFLAELSIPGQLAGKTSLFSVAAAIPATVGAGRFYIFVTADDDHVTDDVNRADNVMRSQPVQVTASTCVLSCDATAPADALVQQPVTLRFLSTLCPPVTISWDLGDGSLVSGSSAVTHTYSNPGIYHWTAKVSSAAGTCNTSGTINVTATNPPVPPKRRAARH